MVFCFNVLCTVDATLTSASTQPTGGDIVKKQNGPLPLVYVFEINNFLNGHQTARSGHHLALGLFGMTYEGCPPTAILDDRYTI